MRVQKFAFYILLLYILQFTFSVGISISDISGNVVIAFLIYSCLNYENGMAYVYVTMGISLVYGYLFMPSIGLQILPIFLAGIFVCFVKTFFVTEGFIIPNILGIISIGIFYFTKTIFWGILMNQGDILPDIYIQLPYILYSFVLFFIFNSYQKIMLLRRAR